MAEKLCFRMALYINPGRAFGENTENFSYEHDNNGSTTSVATLAGRDVTENMSYFYDLGRLVRVENSEINLVDSSSDSFSPVRSTPVPDVLNFNRRLTYYFVNNPIIPSP